MSVKLDIEGIFKNLLICLFFFYQDFLSRTLTTHRTAWEGRGTIFYSTLPLPLSSHQYLDIYFATLRVTWLSYISNRTACIYQAAPQWDLPPIELLFAWLMMWCWLFVYLLIWFRASVTAIWHWRPVDWNSQQLSSLYYKRTD